MPRPVVHAMMTLLLGATWCAANSNTAMNTMSGSVSWQDKPNSTPYGYGKFTAVMQVAPSVAVVTNLNQLAKTQEGFFHHGSWAGLSVWEERITKDTSKTRMYSFDGALKGARFSYTVKFSLSNKGMLTITAKGTNRNYVDKMFSLVNTNTTGISTIYYTLRLKNPSGGTALSISYPVSVSYVNGANSKSTAKKEKE